MPACLAMSMREAALAAATEAFDDGTFAARLAELVACPTESQDPARAADLARYCRELIAPMLEAMGHGTTYYDNPIPGGPPFLIGTRIEESSLPTILTYGHGDVVLAHAHQWTNNRDPWKLTPEGQKLYGRGTADNKGQHLIALASLAAVLKTRGRLGFNSTFILDMGEEVGSPGLDAFIRDQKAALASDLYLALDGPRNSLGRPEIKLGARGAVNFDLVVDLRPGGHHSGHWSGLLRDAGFVLAHALAAIVDRHGRIRVPGWQPAHVPNSVRDACANIVFDPIPGLPEADPAWGEPGLSRAERIYAATGVAVLAAEAGTPAAPVNAVPGRARARIGVRHTVDVTAETIIPALRAHLDAEGFADVAIQPVFGRGQFPAQRTDPADPWVRFTAASLSRTAGQACVVVPSESASSPSGLFAETLGVPTIWFPHSYGGCGQHGPDEHALAPLLREGLRLTTGLYWDFGAGGTPARE
jgi:acetylornithine deacetylase/succinyl-diaminopimelate desuccinylase-like protein